MRDPDALVLVVHRLAPVPEQLPNPVIAAQVPAEPDLSRAAGAGFTAHRGARHSRFAVRGYWL
jgi:hypothetical protein